MLFYALARYNNIAVPDLGGAGTDHPGARPPSRAAAAAAPRSPAPTLRHAPRSEPATSHARAPARCRAGNPAQAARLRGQGLAAMNAGSVDRAVALLRQALALDPDNAAIRNDLSRALRIQSTVRSRR